MDASPSLYCSFVSAISASSILFTNGLRDGWSVGDVGGGSGGAAPVAILAHQTAPLQHQALDLFGGVDLDAAGRKGLALRFVEHQEPAIRKAATFYYFGHPREPADFERALGYLNSEVTVAQQTLIIGKLKRNSPAIYQQLIQESGKVRAEKAKAILEKAAARAKKEAGDDG